MQDSVQQPNKPNLDRNQKIAITVLAVFGFFMILMWMVQFKKNLTSPFENKGNVNIQEETQDLTSPQNNVDDEILKTKDTDGDGLSDWDEINLYHTSPYLEDTDGDSVKDGEEIKKGTDPNCPEGKNCSAPIDNSTSTSSLNNLNPSTSTASSTGFQPNLNASSTEADLQKMLQGNLDAASLRKVLLSSGMDKTALDNISDQDLMSNYKSILSSQ